MSDGRAADESETEGSRALFPANKTKVAAGRVLVFIIVLFCLISVVMVGMASMFVRMEELSICRAWYRTRDPTVIEPDGNVREELCKADQVQAELAFLGGWLRFFETVPGILLGLPYGHLADRRGRRLVFALNLFPLHASALAISAVCYFHQTFPNPKVLWISPLGYLVGGGPQMLGTTLFAMLADVTARDNRPRAFLLMTAVSLIIHLLLAECGSLLLDIGLYTPLMVGLPISMLSLPVVIMMPETFPKSDTETPSNPRQQRNGSQSPLATADASDESFKLCGRNFGTLTLFRTFFTQLRDMPLELLLLFFIFFIGVLDTGTFAYVVQYASKRLEWRIAKVGKLIPVVSIFKLAVLALALPGLMWYLRLRGWSTDRINILVIVGGLIATAGANCIFAFSTKWLQFVFGFFISAFSTALEPSLRSKATELVEDISVAHLYSAITVIQSLARLLVGPMFSYGFRAGLENRILGLPFLIVATAQVFAVLVSITFYA